MKRIRNLLADHWDAVVYLIFGVLTTFVNYIVYFVLYNIYRCSGLLSNTIAWVISVLFAFFTNKPFVFQSHDWSVRIVISEMIKFVGLRVLSGFLETVTIWLFADTLSWNGNWVKIVVSVVVVILNYVFSKSFVFSKKGKG